MRWFVLVVFLGLGALCLQLVVTGALRSADLPPPVEKRSAALLDGLATLTVPEALLLAGAVAALTASLALLARRTGGRHHWERVLLAAFGANTALLALELGLIVWTARVEAPLLASGNLFFLTLGQVAAGTALAAALPFLGKPKTGYATVTTAHLLGAAGAVALLFLGATL